MAADELNVRWAKLVKRLNTEFDQDFEVEGILFLIGLQELGKGYVKLNKHQKMEVMHIAVCALMEKYGYYNYLGKDADGWPHWEPTELLPHLSSMQQHKLIKDAILTYFEENETEE
ncbi:MAG: hypothetical protein ACT6QS_11145 [Flavobacteriales bacterium]